MLVKQISFSGSKHRNKEKKGHEDCVGDTKKSPTRSPSNSQHVNGNMHLHHPLNPLTPKAHSTFSFISQTIPQILSLSLQVLLLLPPTPSTSKHPYYSFTLSLLLFLTTPSMAATTAMYEPIKANPLLQEFDFPLLDVVEAKHIGSRIHALLKNLEYFVLFFLRSFKVFCVMAICLVILLECYFKGGHLCTHIMFDDYK